jgi:MFS family permease
MNPEAGGLAGAISLRRRGSMVGDTSLDYSSCHRVDEDIISRIRSLLLSRNDHRPPRTPCPSDEHNHLCSEIGDTVGGFDIITAKSAAKIGRQEPSRLSTLHIETDSLTSIEMEPRKAARPSLPSIKPATLRLHSNSSATDLKVHVEAEDTRQSPTTVCSDPDFPGERKSPFKLPKLVSQDKKRGNRKVKSCMNINPPVPGDDTKIHETEHLCCPSCDPNNVPKSKYTTSHLRQPDGKVRTIPGDLACFLAGCPPSHLECRKHHRRQNRHSISDRRLAEDYKGATEDLAQESVRIGHCFKEAKPFFRESLGTQRALKVIERRAGRFGSDGEKGVPFISVEPPTSNSEVVSEAEICSSVTSTSDAFPHAFQSTELVDNGTTPHRFSTAVSTNFSLPGYKARTGSPYNSQSSKVGASQPVPPINIAPKSRITFSIPNRIPSEVSPLQIVPMKESEIQLASKSKPRPKSPSLLSSGSRRSDSARHALLKPTVTDTQAVDVGLPIPPVLSPISTIPEQVIPEMPAYYQKLKDVSVLNLGKEGKEEHMSPSVDAANSPPAKETGLEVSKRWGAVLADVQATTAIPIVGHVTSVQNAEFLLQKVQRRVEAQQRIPARPQSPPPTIVKAKVAVDSPQIVAESSQSPPPGNNQQSATQALDAISQSDSLNVAYWGFIPTIKETVQVAVQAAVRDAVRESNVLQGMEKNHASNPYRRMGASSLAEAAKTADDCSSHASLWNEPPSSIQGSDSTVICVPGEQFYDVSSNIENPPTGRLRQASIASKENTEIYDNLMNPALSEDEMEAMPLVATVKPKSRKKRPRPFRNGARFGYDAIPTRESSKNLVLSTGTSTTNVSSNIPRKRSFERVATRVTPRSVSSETSLKHERAGEKLLFSSSELDRRNHHSSASLEQISGRQNTVHWLKGLLPGNDAYEARFTALPPRSLRGPSKSQTAPIRPASELYLEANIKPAEAYQSAVRGEGDERADASENFIRTINDLENLMNEALIIARHATDTQNAGHAPAVLGNVAKVLKTGRDHYHAKLSGILDSEEAPSMHESLRSYSESELSYHSDDPELYAQPTTGSSKRLTIFTQKSPKHSAGLPPTGHVKTPYPPTYMPPSSNSKCPSAEGADYLTAANPRSRSTETEPEEAQKVSSLVQQRTIDEGESLDETMPSFKNPEPFSSPISLEGIQRKSSARSPTGLSHTRQTHTGLQPEPNEFQYIPLPKIAPRHTAPSRRCVQDEHSEEKHQAVKIKLASKLVPNKQEVRDFIKANRNVPIQPRTSSQELREKAEKAQDRDLLTPKTGQTALSSKTFDWQNIDMENMPLVQGNNEAESPPRQEQHSAATEQPDCGQSFDGSQITEEVDFNVGFGVRQRGGGDPSRNGRGVVLQDNPDPNLPQTSKSRQRQAFNLRGKNHVSLNENHHTGFSLVRSHKRQSIARDWSPGRKRFVASVACFSTALIGILVGIYAGETPAIQYYIVDFHYYTVLGNVFFFIGLSVPTVFFWPLPLLHGRKPYILGSMSLAMPLLFPQALAVGSFRSPYVSTYRVGLLLSRAVMGFCLGFANMNFKSMLTDLFGASLQSTNPHQEHVDEFDVRRHGGGMGVWLGVWTWSALGSIGLGFLIGAAIVNHLPPAYGFYVSIVIIAFVMLLNVLCPEVRRSAFRRSVAEVINGEVVSRRLARGEVKMHLVQSGPKWWGEEFHYGVMLSLKMLRQPGFMVMAVYVAWIYGQMVLNILVSVHFILVLVMLTRNSYLVL